MNGSGYWQEKLTIFVADDKIWISKFDNFPIVENFSDEIGGDINKWDFLCIV